MFSTCVAHAAANDRGQAHVANNGSRHFTVDIHCHVHVPEADAMLPVRRGC